MARALLAGGTYRVRAVTRNPDCEAAKKLQEMGKHVYFIFAGIMLKFL